MATTKPTAKIAKALPGVTVAPIDTTRCGARTRNGATCKRMAGTRTTHPGKGRCWMHGGLQEGDARVKSGRYSTVKDEELRQLIEEFENDPDPLNLLPEVHALRALFVDFINRYKAFTSALIAWHADWQLRRRPLPEELLGALERVVEEWEIRLKEQGDDASSGQLEDVAAARRFLGILRGTEDTGKPRQVLDISDAHKILGDIGKMVERIEGLRAANAISRPELNRVISEMGRVVEAYVSDEAAKEKIREGWLAIRV